RLHPRLQVRQRRLVPRRGHRRRDRRPPHRRVPAPARDAVRRRPISDQAARAHRPTGEEVSTADATQARRERRRQQLSDQRRKGLRRLAVLVAGVVVLLVVAVWLLGRGGDETAKNGVVYRDAADTQGPLDILTAKMDQQGPNLVLNMQTADIWTPGQLA